MRKTLLLLVALVVTVLVGCDIVGFIDSLMNPDDDVPDDELTDDDPADDGTPDDPSDLTYLEDELELIEITFANGDSLDLVTRDIQLPDFSPAGYPLAWVSSRPEIVDATGTVSRPNSSEDATVTLTVTIRDGNLSANTTLVFPVLHLPVDDAEAIDQDAANLFVLYDEGDTAASVSGNLGLPDTGLNGSAVVWQSPEPGFVDVPEMAVDGYYYTTRKNISWDFPLDLYAYLDLGTETATGVLSVQITQTADEAAATADRNADILTIGEGDTLMGVTRNLGFAATGGNGSTITWQSSKPAVVSDAGAVTRPGDTAEDEAVELLATVVLGDAVAERRFHATVLSMNPLMPVAAFGVTVAKYGDEWRATFDASASYHPDPLHGITRWEWDFDCPTSRTDSVVVEGLGREIIHSYWSPGVYHPVLRVTDDLDHRRYAYGELVIEEQ